ncbi:hypothetical protein MQ093_09620 [Edwardsiella anguillarum]|uniref:hypothetical protein n=1 Tax=Edwardsiella anguillarum TaxID=1821960 RepID=UPI0024B6AB6B|nr:hypothetical protein [Edwardsiella anguillarum]WHQ26774.1 helix-turn-helix domain containing protein [Edwardsiella anguillarum]
MLKEPRGSFDEPGKEPIIERIFQLVERYPSRSEAARAWGINISTLKNYYKRREQAPIPRHSQIKKIAECEGVSLDWLLNGKESKETKEPEPFHSPQGEGVAIEGQCGFSATDIKLLTLLSFLSDSEKQSLAELLGRKGVEFTLSLLEKDTQGLLKLEGRKRLAALMLVDMPDERVREILAEIENDKPAADVVNVKAG